MLLWVNKFRKQLKIGAFVWFLALSAGLHFMWLILPRPGQKPPRKLKSQLVFVQAGEQIVSQKDFNRPAPSQDTHYLSRANKTVETQTQAMMHGLFEQAGLSRRPASRLPERFSSPHKSFKKPRGLALSKDLLNKITAPLQLDVSAFDASAGAELSRTMDFLPEVETGSHTLLNTKEFIYYSYFSRMKKQLYVRWVQSFQKDRGLLASKLGKHRPRQLFSTHLYILLSPAGELTDLRVSKSSGEEDIDSLALHAFMASAPFPNPPKGLVSQDGYIHIQQSFHLYVHRLFSSVFRRR